MCGLFGWLDKKGKEIPRKRQLLSMLTALNDERGGDSYGFATKKDVVKGLGEAYWLDNESKKGLASERMLIGHTRKATTGDITRANSHPFTVGDVTGAHNGMVTNHSQLNAAYGRDFQVDSQHIFAHLDEGAESFADVEAYGAIVFKIGEDGEAYLGKFNSGELSVVETKNGYVWSSDGSHLEKALDLAGVRGKRVKTRQGTLYSLTPDTIYRLAMPLDFTSPWKAYSRSIMSMTGSDVASSTACDEEDFDKLLDWEDYAG